MNPLLNKLQPYPFERLRHLTAGVVPSAAHRPISLGIGEPKHATPEFIKQALVAGLGGLASYPATAGEPALRVACADWMGVAMGSNLIQPHKCCPSTARAKPCSHWLKP
jgi:N-succinyldiaminopimelate aminotransferase